ncbi:radiation-inducible immediate-early gene IEX-1-like [Stegostoma tigrinum]|uniref:radiation-inducible immediate-early gene IEX-1-like n=1 Tax=Stegostoma tigrinum TaxID=3053191 RepID=UPI00202B691E|nr:radiation-inducible immediate-early gene IEX-1-like [Stegostoma tigrinum]
MPSTSLPPPLPVGQSYSFSTRRSTEPEIFTFDPIPLHKPSSKAKRRSLKVLYPIYQSRKSHPTRIDLAKRLFLVLLSIVILQVYSTTETEEEEANLVSETLQLETRSEPSLPAGLALKLDSASICILTVPQGAAGNNTVSTV